MEIIVSLFVAIICFVGVYFLTPKNKVTQDKLESFAQESDFIEINSEFGVGLAITNGQIDYNKGLGDLGYNTYESLVAFFSKYDFVLREHNELNHRYYLQKNHSTSTQPKGIEYYYELYQKGIITELEYNKKKQELL